MAEEHVAQEGQVSDNVARFFMCASCGKSNPDWRSFGYQNRSYCLDRRCIPLLARIKLRLSRD